MTKQFGRIISLLLIIAAVLTLTPAALADGFADVDGSAWYASAVDYVASKGLFSGTGDGIFSPDAAMTRGMFVTVLSRMAGADTENSPDAGFSDVDPTAWYSGAVNWAADSGYAVVGEDGYFRPEENVTREEAADFLARYLIGTDAGTGTPDEITEVFADAGSVSGWAADSVEFLRSTGLMTGDENGNFNPQKGLTRAEAAAVFMRIGERTSEKSPPDGGMHPTTEDFLGLYEYTKDAVSYRLNNNRKAEYMTKPLSEWTQSGLRLRMNCAELVTYAYMYWLGENLGYELSCAPELSELYSGELHFVSAYGWYDWAEEEDAWEVKSYDGYRSLPKTNAMAEIKEDMDSGSLPVGSLVIFSAMSGQDPFRHIGIYVGKGEDGGHYILHCTKTDSVSGVRWETIDDIVYREGASIRPRYAIIPTGE